MRIRAHPEALIASGYIIEECMTFCASYLVDVETKPSQPIRNFDGDDRLGLSSATGLIIEWGRKKMSISLL